MRGDAALAAKAIANFRKEYELLAFKGGVMNGEPLTVDQIEDIAKLPARDVLDGRLVGILASPVTGLVNGLNNLIQGLALQLGQMAEQGLVSGEAPPAEEAPEPEPEAEAPAEEEAEAPAEEAEAPAEEAEAPAEEPAAEESVAEAEEAPAAEDAPAEEAAAETESNDEPSEGDDKEG